MSVDLDRAAQAKFEPGIAREGRIGRDAYGEHHHVARDGVVFGGMNEQRPFRIGVDRAIPSMCVFKSRSIPASLRRLWTMAAMSGSMSFITWELRCTIATSMPRSRRFSAISSPMNPAPTTTAREARSASTKCLDRVGVLDRPQGEHARIVHAGYIRHHRTRARRQDETIVGLPVERSVVEATHDDMPSLAVDRDDLLPHAHVDAKARLEALGRLQRQLALVGDDVSHVIRQAAVRV